MDLRSAVAQTLASSSEGLELLLVPRRFLSYLADLGMGDTAEYKVLRDHADGQLLKPFYDATQGDVPFIGASLRSAARKTSNRICDTWIIDRSVAESLCDGLAAGVADYLGIPWSRTVQEEDENASPGSTMRREPTVVVAPEIPESPGMSEDATPTKDSTKSRTPVIVAAVLIALVAAIGGFFVFAKPAQTDTAVVQHSGTDDSEKEISSILASAKEKADQDDYDAAYKLIKDGLKKYPDSQGLQEKSDEYRRERDEIEDIIDRAQANASSDSYDRALDVIDEGIESYPKSQKLKDERASIQKRKEKYEKEQEQAAQREEQTSNGEQNADTTSSEPEQQESSAPAAPEEEQKAFPAHWAGSYTGNSLDDAGNHIPVPRKVWFDLTESDGQISGTCSVGNEDGSDTVDGKFNVTGTYDRQTGAITINGVSWVFQGDLWGMRNFWGTVDSSMSSMSGSCIGLSSGETSDWSATAG